VSDKDPRRLLGKEDVASILGVRPEIVQAWLNAGHLHGFLNGREWKISPRAVDLLLERLATGETSYPVAPASRARARRAG
jgi:hypothetical protein